MASYDAVGSSVGIMFAPDHAAAASELARITKPGGRIALANWTPGPGVQDVFKVMPPSSPHRRRRARSTGATRRRCGGFSATRSSWQFETKVNTVTYDSVEDYWQDFAQNYGPTKITVRVARRSRRGDAPGLAGRVRRPTALHAGAPVPAREAADAVDARSSTSCSG